MNFKPLPNRELLHELLEYRPESGLLFWRKRSDKFSATPALAKSWNTQNAGKRAFIRINSSGYYVGAIFGNLYMAHRIVWAMHHSEPLENQIDHINRNKLDNRVENLRVVSNQQNHKNMPKLRNNTSGSTGVYWHKGRNRWTTSVRVNGVLLNLGRFKDKRDAIAARQRASSLHGFEGSHGQ